MRVLGWIAVVAGIGLTAFGLLDDGILKWMWVSLGFTALLMGLVFVAVGGYMRKLRPDSIKGGIATTARVLSTRDTGVTINNVNMVLLARVLVDGVPNTMPYEADTRVTLGRTQWGAIQPGMVLPVVVDPDDHQRVAFDPSRPVGMAAPTGMTGMTGAAGMPGAAAAQPQVVQRSAADIVARGVPTTGVLQSVVPTGMVAGQVAGGLAPDQADDPLVQITLMYEGPGGQQLTTTAMMRVPDGRAGYLATGAVVPVRYLVDEPDTATVDWDRL
jgi:hypothetical protein